MERRLVTILAADAVGYSKRMARDEGSAYTALSRCRSIIDQAIEIHRGRIFGSAGDSVIAEFNSSVNAVQCAIEIQQRLAEEQSGTQPEQPLSFRIGINFGDVIVEDDNLLGDGVNVAARLEAIAPENGICIAANVKEQVAGKVKAELGYGGRHSLKNIKTPVDVWCWPESAGSQLKRTALRRSSYLVPSLIMLLAVILIAFGYAHLLSTQKLPVSNSKIALAVLPFANISNDPNQEYFVDGITSDLITDLSKISALFVIARNSVFAYKGHTVNIKKVADELGVRYILEGSIRASNGRVRVNSRLIDSSTGGQLWSDRFDRKMGDVFALQDEVTGKIVSALKLELTFDEKANIRNTKEGTSPEAYDLFLRGFQAIRQFTPESTKAARIHFLRALAIDPNYARAYAALAYSYTSGGLFYSTDSNEEATLQALNYGRRALQINGSLPEGHFSVAMAQLRRGRHQEALVSVEEAIRHDPNYSDGYAALSAILAFSGKGQEAADSMRRAMSLNPKYSSSYIAILGRAQLVNGEYDKAITNFRECIIRNPSALTCHVFLAAIFGIKAQKEEAEWQAQEILSLAPKFNLSSNVIIKQFTQKEDRERLLSGLRVAGIPEK